MTTLFSLENKVALVTGALGLLGKEHCYALSEAGAHLVLTDVDHRSCQSLAREFRSAIGVGADITSKASVEALHQAALERFGKVDVLVNNAALNDKFESPQAAADLSKFENYPLELWQRAIDVNVTGMFLSCQVIGAEMAKHGSGSIVNVASTYGLVAPDQSLYCKPDGTQSFYKSAAYPVTKGAVISLTRFLATYWGAHNVRVNALCPGGVENGQDEYFVTKYAHRTPLGRMAAKDDYRGAIVFLASRASSYMTGSILVVDGGWTAW